VSDPVDTELAGVGVVLLEDRVVRRVIKAHRRLPGLGLQVPHAHGYGLPAAALRDLVEPGELAVDAAALPARVILFSGSRAALGAGDPHEWARAWRAAFHGAVHAALEAKLAAGLTEAAVRERINRIGQTEFDEIRSVLAQEELLLPPRSDPATYTEFAAVYLELAHFAPRALSRTFPTLAPPHVDAVLAADLDPHALLAATRPPRAPAHPTLPDEAPPTPAVVEPTLAPPPKIDPKARAAASKARVKGNRARAAILSLRAGDRDGAIADLDALAARLATAVGSAPTDPWTMSLLPLAEHAAAQKNYLASARLLQDLQTACIVGEREVKVVDLAGWAWAKLLRKRRPLVRALPATREVRVARRLHAAAGWLADAGLASISARDKLAAAIHDIVERGDLNVRVQLRPKIETALAGVNLVPRNLPERVAQKKLVDELLDRAVAAGTFSIGHLRDAISHNDLKLPDLTLRTLRGRDELLGVDVELARTCEGVYRRGEGYLRALQRLSSIFFGTRVGRFLSLYLLLPFIGAYVILAGLQHTVGLLIEKTAHVKLELATEQTVAICTAALFLLIHLRIVRTSTLWVLGKLWFYFVAGVVIIPRSLWRHPLMRRALNSRVMRWLVEPAIPAAIVWLLVPGTLRWPIAGAVFLAAAFGWNTRAGRRAREHVGDWLLRSARHLSTRLAPGMIKWLVDIFAEVLEHFERGIYRVDEWLRYKSGQSRVTLVLKGVVGAIWGFFVYLLRLYVNLFMEPEVNPVKHFPTVTVAAKITIPLTPQLMGWLKPPFEAVLGPTFGTSFAAFTLFVLPGLAGFLVWELKENWKLYRATRPTTLDAAMIGSHGETMVALLKLGFHSGTLPKAYTRLRRAAWKSDERGVARQREHLHHIEEAIEKFTERELASLLDEAPTFRAKDVRVTRVTAGSNRVQIYLACPSVDPELACLSIEQQSGWIVAGIHEPGWFAALDDGQRQILEVALAGFYKLAGVQLVREQLEAIIGKASYDIADEGLVLWPGPGYVAEVVYDLTVPFPTPRCRDTPVGYAPPALGGKHALYCHEPLRWTTWTGAWEQLARGDQCAPIVVGPSLLRKA
jgi:hypothetical protein